MKAIAVSALILTVVVSAVSLQGDSVASATSGAERDESLFLEGAKAISREQFDQARILLNTMIYTYPDSSLVDQAKLLVFYTYARQGGPKNQKAAGLLKEIEAEIKTYERSQRFQ